MLCINLSILRNNRVTKNKLKWKREGLYIGDFYLSVNLSWYVMYFLPSIAILILKKNTTMFLHPVLDCFIPKFQWFVEWVRLFNFQDVNVVNCFISKNNKFISLNFDTCTNLNNPKIFIPIKTKICISLF